MNLSGLFYTSGVLLLSCVVLVVIVPCMNQRIQQSNESLRAVVLFRDQSSSSQWNVTASVIAHCSVFGALASYLDLISRGKQTNVNEGLARDSRL